MATLRRLTGAALDLAFPRSLFRVRKRGRAPVSVVLPALDARLPLPGGTPIGLPAEIPRPPPAAGVVRHRSPVRSAQRSTT
jgi:hypothetical protein